jgi:hydroxymethylpyrimidine kinase/phosphomethylpyrimidine kinase/thiamine-phosphate diphosphorylase
MHPTPPIIWSIAGHDSSGGAGLSADQRAADAMGVHLCPVVAALTAQHSQGVQAVFPLATVQMQAQLRALADDMPPRAIKTGLLGSVAAIELVAQWVDRWRALTPTGVDPHRHLALIVDPVLGASSGGAAFSNESVMAAYRTLLLPRATVITPNRAEARRLLGLPGGHDAPDRETPDLARELQALGVRSVVITGGDAPSPAHCLDWISTPHAQGWLTAPRVDTPHNHGTGCTFASAIAAACALGHVDADAIVLAKMLTHHALTQAHAAGTGAGPVIAQPGFAAGPPSGGAPLPWLGLGTELPWQLTVPRATAQSEALFQPFKPPADGLYGILANSEQIDAALQAGLSCLQLRHKARDGLETQLSRSLQQSMAAGTQLFINDHWRDALALSLTSQDTPAPGFKLGLHLGQEDLLALSAVDQASLLAARHRVMLGLSSHSLWELARAAGCGASTIACGPVLPTTTKDMPWLPQGQDNLSWWVRHSPSPVVAIGGLLTPDDVQRFTRCRPAAVCIVRGLGQTLRDMQQAIPSLRQALTQALAQPPQTPPPLPHPVQPIT